MELWVSGTHAGRILVMSAEHGEIYLGGDDSKTHGGRGGNCHSIVVHELAHEIPCSVFPPSPTDMEPLSKGFLEAKGHRSDRWRLHA